MDPIVPFIGVKDTVLDIDLGESKEEGRGERQVSVSANLASPHVPAAGRFAMAPVLEEPSAWC